MREKIVVALFALLVLLGTFDAQAQAIPSNIQNPIATFQQWLPILSVAILLSICIAAILYMIGKFLNDQQISARGISELGQAIGTGIYAVLAIGALLLFGSLISHSNLLTGSFPSEIATMCQNFQSSQLAIVSQNPTLLVCDVAKAVVPGSTDVSATLNYGLASSYIIIANLTNQASANIDSLYTYEGMIGFLQTLSSDPGLCEPATPLLNCATDPLIPRWFSVDLSSKPLAGYQLISAMTRPLEAQAIFVFYMLLTQLIIYFILLNIWPYLLAAGIVLRAFSFTRGAGGLLIGITLVIVIVLPMVLLIEYNALGHGVSTSQLAGNAAGIQDNVIYGLKVPSCGLITGCLSINWGDPQMTTTGDYVLTHTYQQPGTYTVIATVNDAKGNKYTAQQQITVPQAVPSAAPDTTQMVWMANPTISGLTATVCPTGPAGVCAQYDALAPNFYVFPSIKSVINFNGCWPLNGDLAGEEAIDSLKMATLGVGSALSFGGFVSAPPDPLKIGIQCNPSGALGTTLELMGIYGLMSVVGFVLPLFNILIMLSAIKNVSYLFGGDTDIAGLGKLV